MQAYNAKQAMLRELIKKRAQKLVDRNQRLATTLVPSSMNRLKDALTPQMADYMQMTTSDNKSENITFTDTGEQHATWIENNVDPTRQMQDQNDVLLSDFFKRPIRIYEREWQTGVDFAANFNPWQDYFEDPRVQNRLTNYALLRANLCLKFIINGNSFQYGRILTNYLPYFSADAFSGAGTTIYDYIQFSQQPHLYLDPCESKGGMMRLPFFWHKNYLSIPDREWRDMGQVFVSTLTSLKHANGASDKVTISVFAWAENVQVSMLTNTDIDSLDPQMADEIDEANQSGIISGPATALSNMSKAMGKVFPTIAPFAMATSTVADVVGGIAKVFGYSRPNVTKSPEPYRPMQNENLALTTTPSLANKLTVDDKQELTIDPRIAGISAEDPMNITRICTKEAWLTSFTWAVGVAPETKLFEIGVTPHMFRINPSDEDLPRWFLPCGVCASAFEYWSGTMEFRFQVVKSSFHRGRLRFVYDPIQAPVPDEYNTNYTRIIDVTENSDIKMSIGMAQTLSLLETGDRVLETDNDLLFRPNETTPTSTNIPIQPWHNGTLSVYVVNELTVPNSSINNDVQVNVFVNAGDDMEFFVPRDDQISRYVFAPQMAEFELEPQMASAATDVLTDVEESAPEIQKVETLGPNKKVLNDMNKVFAGERIESFRPLLHRGQLHESFTIGSAQRTSVITRHAFPYLRGNIPGAVHTTSGGAPYNYCNTILLHWIPMCFQGHRGSIRVQLCPRNYSNASSYHTFVTRTHSSLGYTVTSVADSAAISESTAAFDAVFGALAVLDPALSSYPFSGTNYQNGQVNPANNFEIPYYSQFRFAPGKFANWTVFSNTYEGYRLSLYTNTSHAARNDLFISAGEDFQCYFWTGLPKVYVEDDPPNPAP
jgi:hypothetical protein